MRPTLWVASAIIAVIVGGMAWLMLAPSGQGYTSPALVDAAGGDVGGAFTLIDHTGRTVTDAEVIDGPALVYFGYTFCPDVCPVDVQIMAETVDMLAADGVSVKPVFITVDPARDTVEALADYAGAMHPDMIALTGSDEQIKTAAAAYKVYYAKVDSEGSGDDYLMNHTAFMYLMSPDQGLLGLFRRGFGPEQFAKDVKALLGGV